MASSSLVKILQQIPVHPPKGSVPTSSLPLTFFDLLWLYSGTVERVFFYSISFDTERFVEHVVPTLVSSLSMTLEAFFPLAGHVRLSGDSEDLYEIYYADGDSVAFTVAECDGDFEELKSDRARRTAELKGLVPGLSKFDESKCSPLFAVQATLFPNHGLSIGVAVQHIAFDGASSMHFMKSWAAACKSAVGRGSPPPIPPPVHDRSLVQDPKGLYSLILKNFRELRTCMEKLFNNYESSSNSTVHEDVVLSSFIITREKTERLKQVVFSKSAAAKRPHFHCSTFVVTAAYVLACLEAATSQRYVFCCVVDCRARHRPPIPKTYFGNCLSFIVAERDEGEKNDISDKETNFLINAEAIGREIDALNRVGIFDDAEKGVDKGRELSEKKIMGVTGSPNLRVYETDFGWGKPEKVEVISITDGGAMSLAENNDINGDGGIQVGLCLAKKDMQEFTRHFYDGLLQFE